MSDKRPWYRLDRFDAKLPERIAGVIQNSEKDRRDSITDATIGQWFYERDRYRGYRYTGLFDGRTASRLNRVTNNDTVDPAFNLIKSAVDKMTADLLRVTPALTVGTVNGRFEDRQQDAIRSRLLLAMVNESSVRRARRHWIRDGLTQRVGFVWPRYQTGKLVAQRLHHYQVFWDCRAALNADPPDLHVVELLDRHDLINWYQERKDDIPDKDIKLQQLRDMRPATVHVPGLQFAPWVGAYHNCLQTIDASDNLRVVWSWKRSWREGKPDGRAVATVLSSSPSDSVTLFDHAFSRTTFPVVWWSPWETSFGIDGISLSDLLIPTQLALAHVMHRVAMMMRKHGAHKLIIPSTMDPALAAAFESAGFEVVWDPSALASGGMEEPRMYKPYTLDRSDMAYIQFLLTQPTEIIGISRAALQGEDAVSPGASGVARLQAKFEARDRQMAAIEAYTGAHKQLGDEVLNAADDALATDKDFRTSFELDGVTKMLPWSQYSLANDARCVSVQEVGLLGETVAGQVQALQELGATGAIPQDVASEFVMQQPDVQRVGSLVFAPRRAIERHLSILSNPDAEEQWATAQPTEDMDLEQAVKMTTRWINLAIEQQAADATLARLRAYLLAAATTLATIAPGPPTVAPAVSGLANDLVSV